MASSTHYVAADTSTAVARKLRTLQTAESLAMLDESLLYRKRLHEAVSDVGSEDNDDFDAVPTMAPLSLRISLRRGRLAMLVAVVIAFVTLITLALAHGAELDRFDRKDVSAAAQSKLLDRYNSYSGSVASALGRPLELCLVVVAQLAVLWFMTDAVLATDANKWRAKLAVAGIGAVAGFLLLNGLNALNVQIRQLPVKMVLSLSDLRVETTAAAANSSTVASSFSERSPSNPLTNTILRNLVLPRATTTLKCTNDSRAMQEDIVAYRVPQREWMKSFLPESLPNSTWRFDLQANTSTDTISDFPMNASAAVDLVCLCIYISCAPFGAVTPFMHARNPLKWYGINSTNPRGNAPTSRLSGLLPPAPNSTETQDREWFTATVAAYMTKMTADAYANKTATLRRTLELSRVNITSSMWMEAVTLESEMIPDKDGLIFTDGAWYMEGLKERESHLYMEPTGQNHGSSMAHRVFLEDERPHAGTSISIFASCVNSNGTSALTSFVDVTDYRLTYTSGSALDCAKTSSSEVIVLAQTKYFVADALDDFVVLNTTQGQRSVVKNPRVVYSTTIGRVRWQAQNLSESYEASCNDHENGCMGLDASLSSANQRLLVSTTAIPLTELSPIFALSPNSTKAQQPLDIVYVRRPIEVISQRYTSLSKTQYANDEHPWLGSILLPHNVGTINVRDNVEGISCYVALERRIQTYINNHIYMEATMQPAYTAAAFFLFQNGVARDVLPSSAAATANVTPLNLDENIQEMSVWMSIPRLNVIMTLIGCVLLVGGLIFSLVPSRFTAATQELRENITAAHQIARVMVDDTTFPSLLLYRRFSTKHVDGDASEFVIDAMSVQPATAQIDDEKSVEV